MIDPQVARQQQAQRSGPPACATLQETSTDTPVGAVALPDAVGQTNDSPPEEWQPANGCVDRKIILYYFCKQGMFGFPHRPLGAEAGTSPCHIGARGRRGVGEIRRPSITQKAGAGSCAGLS
jgi:hypothetical protein